MQSDERKFLKMDDFASSSAAEKAVLMPVGAVEAHGHHLPVETDNIIAEALVSELAKRTNLPTLPLLAYGYVKGLRDYDGSVTLGADTFKMVLRDISVSLSESGFSRLCMVNCHIPNSPLIDEVSLLVKDKIKLLNFSFFGIDHVLKNICTSKQWHPGIFHAEEIETSLMLYLRPELVDMDKAEPSYPQKPRNFGLLYTSWKEFTPEGVIGDPTQATSKKGENIFRYLVDEIVSVLQT
ncbi:MAG TPA: creatininase family protein [Candidatus Bathyarchaeia archaeon]|nr:creatininase family protein [Candidatus Bathyarchaeia archaeon]